MNLYNKDEILVIASECLVILENITQNNCIVDVIKDPFPMYEDSIGDDGKITTHLINGIRHFDIRIQPNSKEKTMDFSKFRNEVLVPMISVLSEKINSLNGEYVCIQLPTPETGTSAIITDGNLSLRVVTGHDMETLSTFFAIDIAIIQKRPAKVFLGGTCNGSPWRDALIGVLKIDYFNPVVEEWTEECMQEEIRQRQECDVCLYTITPRMTGTYSIAEVVDDSNKRPEKTVLCITEFDVDPNNESNSITYDPHVAKSLKQVARMVQANGGRVFQTLQETAEYLNK